MLTEWIPLLNHGGVGLVSYTQPATNLVNAKLTWVQVQELRQEHQTLRKKFPRKFPTGVIGALEKKYGICKTNITDIIKERTWKTNELMC